MGQQGGCSPWLRRLRSQGATTIWGHGQSTAGLGAHTFLMPHDAATPASACFRDFVGAALVKDPRRRPTARQLLAHDFVRRATPHALIRLLEDGASDQHACIATSQSERGTIPIDAASSSTEASATSGHPGTGT